MYQKAKAVMADPSAEPGRKANAQRLIDVIEADIARMRQGQ
jgi:hypothetical protein